MDGLEEDLLVTLPAASKLLPISQSYLYELAKAGLVPVVHLGNKILIRQSVVDRLRTDGTSPLIKP